VWAIDITGRPANYDDEHTFADPHPVPAVEELKRDGKLASTPTTHLTGDKIVDPV